MKMIIPSTKIKYIKLFIISPLYEIFSNLGYLVSFFLLTFELIDPNRYLSNYKKNTLISRTFHETEFKQLKSDTEFLAYLDFLVPKLYNYVPLNGIPIMIPFGDIRIQKYSNKAELCSEQIKSGTKCTDSQWTSDFLNNLYKNSFCGYPNEKKYYKVYKDFEVYPSKFRKLVKRLEGKYSTYNLITEGINLDFNIDDYKERKEEIEAFVKDYDLKFLTIQFNLYFPTEDDYVLVLVGVEMINYFLFPYTIFTSTIYTHFNLKNTYFISVYILFAFYVSLKILRFIYEVNIRFELEIHPFILIKNIYHNRNYY